MTNLAAPTVATCAVAKTNGWTRFINHVADGNPVLLSTRSRTSKATGQRTHHPLLAVAVPTNWVDYISTQDQAPQATVETITSHQARQHLTPYCKKLYAAQADGNTLQYEVRGYRTSGTLKASDAAAASHDLFTLVQVNWFALSTNITPRELADVDALLPWINHT